MRIKNFTAPDMPTALAQVREMLGADAVIISQEKNAAGEIELTAAPRLGIYGQIYEIPAP